MIQNLTVDDKNFLTGVAKKIIELKLVTPAIFFFEMVKPLNFIGSQTMVFFGPIVSAFVKTDGYYRAAELFESNVSVEFLISELERLGKNG
ncbi:MAG: hypothetical protein CM1200mP31_5140 [Candidatus Neomarinimicrobiota bacterium]|jgi:hypothetical protein|nr:MAG: hypothetical protein CM1200mP31_5140 [Candidatus Neomarinimicrobiota bacterium]|tara:strand:+ start:408 stop:680 length:273 start_codon:yes stop_codon:yes gene_type:complete